MSIEQALVTAEEFIPIARDRDGLVDLVRGQVVELQRSGAQHGTVCVQVAVPLLNWVKATDSGYVMTNNVGIQTEDDPDTIRGPDVIFVGKSRLPNGLDHKGWLMTPPNMCIEVLSPFDVPTDIANKIAEYIALGIPEVWILDPTKHQVQIHLNSNGLPATLGDGDMLTSDRLPGFECAVSELFEGC